MQTITLMLFGLQKVVLSIVLICCLAACQQEIVVITATPSHEVIATPTPAERATPYYLEVTVPEIEQELFELINQARQTERLEPYILDEELSDLAQVHSQDMVDRNYLSHTSPGGKTPADRFEAYGIETQGFGENIQRNPNPSYLASSSAFEAFMENDSHRDNILDTQFDHVGIGVAKDSSGRYLLTILFAHQPERLSSPDLLSQEGTLDP